MKSPFKSGRWAYVTFGALSLLVFGVLVWATAVSLRLDHGKRIEATQKSHRNRVRLAINRMESWANPILFSEFRRGYADYAPVVVPNEVRLVTGEMLAPGSVVQLSSLLTRPMQYDWMLLHFQVSPDGVFGSPQIPPIFARAWPGVLDDATILGWARYEARLAGLAYAFSIDDLAESYDTKRRQLFNPDAPVVARNHSDEATNRSTPTATILRTTAVRRENYEWRRSLIHRLQPLQTPRLVCAHEQVAVANINALPAREEAIANQDEDSLIGIRYENMVPLWIKLAGHASKDIMFLRALDANGARVFQGFVVDWPTFRGELLAQVSDLFPEAGIDIIDSPSDSPDDTVFSLFPARFQANAPDLAIASMAWNDTHWFLLLGWCGSIVLLVTLGLSLRSMLRLSERRSQFAYAVTHELRTPLTTFQLYTDMLANGLVPEKDRQDYLDTLNQESLRLSGLVSGVLEHSRIESESVPVSKDWVALSEILEDVRQAHEAQCVRANVQLRVSDADPRVMLSTDRQLTVQILGNLIDNARKYGRNGEASSVDVSATMNGSHCAIEVADHGPGVPTRLRSAIFKPYERGDQDAATVTGGIGLGLALSRSWAKLLGGQLELVSTGKEKGARFRLTLEATHAPESD
ncbi:MAG: HAMP domain-containing histidine kinase [Planctomycetes bacterium]|nr:HAMP domain-containing histidine kinase [Planctomycetota bacterium]